MQIQVSAGARVLQVFFRASERTLPGPSTCWWMSARLGLWQHHAVSASDFT